MDVFEEIDRIDKAVLRVEMFKGAICLHELDGICFSPCTNPVQAYEIIKRERISVLAPTTYFLGKERHEFRCDDWRARFRTDDDCTISDSGKTPLIAAMKCYIKINADLFIDDEVVSQVEA